MRGKGINYDTGFLPGEHDSRPDFDPAVVAAEMRIIARELGCTAVRVSGSRPERISVAAQAAAAEGLEVWFAPFPPELTTAELIGLFRDCADRAEQVRREGARVVLVMGCEVTLFNPGFLPGTYFYDRMRRLGTPSPRLYASFALMPRRLNAFLADYLGNLSYALTGRNFNPVIAMAADTTIVCADNIVPVGLIAPDHVVTPAPLVDYLIMNG